MSAVRQIDHIGIAVRSIEAALPIYRDMMGLTYLGDEVVEAEGVRAAFLQIGEVRIELLEPLTADSPIGRFLEKRGEGIHHIAVRVDDIHAARSRATGCNVRLLKAEATQGAHGSLVSFLHPSDTGKVLLELVQPHE